MKATFKTAASIGIRLTGVDRLVGALTGSSRIPAVISYHRVVENIEESSRSSISSMLISTRMFEQHLDWIGRHYEFISLDDIGSRLETDVARYSNETELIVMPAPNTGHVQPTSFEHSSVLMSEALAAGRRLLRPERSGTHLRLVSEAERSGSSLSLNAERSIPVPDSVEPRSAR